LLANPNPIIPAYKEGYTSVQAVVASTTKTKPPLKKNNNKQGLTISVGTRLLEVRLQNVGVDAQIGLFGRGGAIERLRPLRHTRVRVLIVLGHRLARTARAPHQMALEYLLLDERVERVQDVGDVRTELHVRGGGQLRVVEVLEGRLQAAEVIGLKKTIFNY
jgi:hypothetical protein